MNLIWSHAHGVKGRKINADATRATISLSLSHQPSIHLYRFQPDGGAATDTKLHRLRLRLGRFSTAKSKTGSAVGVSGPASGGRALGLVDGNSTNTVNTVEDTEFSSSNVDSKSRAGVEVCEQYKH